MLISSPKRWKRDVYKRQDYMDKPLEAQVMKTVTVETFGVDYPEPETV